MSLNCLFCNIENERIIAENDLAYYLGGNPSLQLSTEQQEQVINLECTIFERKLPRKQYNTP
jgi:hypothetical protein